MADQCKLTVGQPVWGEWRQMSRVIHGLTLRKQCGVLNDTDVRAIRSIHLSRGCTEDTPVGQYFTDLINQPLSEDIHHPGLAELEIKAPVAAFRICEITKALPWPDDARFLVERKDALNGNELSTFQAFFAHIEAIQSEITWALRNL
jgi:hypothetical protein